VLNSLPSPDGNGLARGWWWWVVGGWVMGPDHWRVRCVNATFLLTTVPPGAPIREPPTGARYNLHAWVRPHGSAFVVLVCPERALDQPALKSNPACLPLRTSNIVAMRMRVAQTVRVLREAFPMRVGDSLLRWTESFALLSLRVAIYGHSRREHGSVSNPMLACLLLTRCCPPSMRSYQALC
jgi:hypothetical protein